MQIDIELGRDMAEQIGPVYLLGDGIDCITAQKHQKPLHADAETEDRAPEEHRHQAHNNGGCEPAWLYFRH